MKSRTFSLLAVILLAPALAAATAALPAPSVGQIMFSDTNKPPLPAAPPRLEPVRTLPPAKVLTMEELNCKRLQRLQAVARDLRDEQGAMSDFDGYLKWMGGALAGYAKYVEAGSFAAGFARYLPVPYAGQAGQLTKFISHFALSLSATSAAVTSYMNSSGYFIAGVEAIGDKPGGKENELAQLTFYADQQLSRDLLELQGRLASISDLSGSALGFLLGLQQYLGSTDEYWQKTKSLVAGKDTDKIEKGALSGSIDGLRTRAENFNSKLKHYDATVSSTMPRIASLVAYDELRQDMEAKAAVAAPAMEIQKNLHDM